MARALPRRPLIAVDTNVPLDLAEGKEPVLDALELIRRRLKPARIILTPTPFQELVFLSEHGEKRSERQQALDALRNLGEYGLELLNLIPVAHGIVEQIASRLQEVGLLPPEEYNDGLILAEAALVECAILLSSDAHLRGMHFERASLELRTFDVEMPVIATPREIVRKFSQ